jgi:predicted DNA-binding antitoxin AbrB/MazE fold protein
MKRFHAIYEDGLFKPTQPVDLPDKTEVEVELRSVAGNSSNRPSRNLSLHNGALKALPVDPLQFQRRLREEWD